MAVVAIAMAVTLVDRNCCRDLHRVQRLQVWQKRSYAYGPLCLWIRTPMDSYAYGFLGSYAYGFLYLWVPMPMVSIAKDTKYCKGCKEDEYLFALLTVWGLRPGIIHTS